MTGRCCTLMELCVSKSEPVTSCMHASMHANIPVSVMRGVIGNARYQLPCKPVALRDAN